MTNTCPPDAAVTVDALTKRYGRHTVVDRLTMHLPRGAVAGFVGPNGAGKTTAMAMLLGLVRPTSGTATVLGHPIHRPDRYLHRVGALIEGPGFHPALSGTRNLRVLAAMGGHDETRIPEVLDMVGLTARAGDPYRRYSLGMKQRLGIAGALLGDPDLVVLDEPTNGLDPAGMAQIRRLVAEIAAQGRTVLVSSHLLGELEQVCDWLVILDRGALRYQGPTSQVAGGADIRLTAVPEHDRDLPRLGDLLARHGLAARRSGREIQLDLTGHDGHAAAAEVNRAAHAAGITLAGLHQHRPSLQDRVLALIGADR